jgi:hypothetical protein
VVAVVAGALLGQSAYGFAVAAGLVIGSFNPSLIGRALRLPVSFRLTSIGRILAMTALAIGVGALLGGGLKIAFVALGVALAQGVLAAVALREMLRA